MKFTNLQELRKVTYEAVLSKEEYKGLYDFITNNNFPIKKFEVTPYLEHERPKNNRNLPAKVRG